MAAPMPREAPVTRTVRGDCGIAGGRHPKQGPGGAGAIFQNSSVAAEGDFGSQLPPMPPQAVWAAGSNQEVGWTVQELVDQWTLPTSGLSPEQGQVE